MKTLLILIAALLLLGCNSRDSDIKNNVAKTNGEQKYANVFKPLDGIWEGEFNVYIDTLGQRAGLAQPKEIDFDSVKKSSLKLQSVIKAKHIYKSVDPFRQDGEIIDIIIKSDGSADTIISKATNYIENGKLKCVVHKPDETVIHDGEYLGNNTIVWQRKTNNPLKIEYFKEIVIDNHYKIIGWGYYGKDDPNLTPRIWFYADYERGE
jgi:Tfp pilus assembly protein PilP